MNKGIGQHFANGLVDRGVIIPRHVVGSNLERDLDSGGNRLADPEEEIKNTIGNLTLLDAATNRMYGNSLFCTKRRINIERIKQGVFVPVATQYIFAKFFDQKGTNRSLWTKEDMEAYHSYIYNVISNYLINEED